MTPYPHQITGADFLASRSRAILADEPRVGKTGSALMALRSVDHGRTLIITTSSGRKVWQRAVEDWLGQGYASRTATSFGPVTPDMLLSDILIVGWDAMSNRKKAEALSAAGYDTVIADEAHYVKDFSSKRTKAFYDLIAKRAKRVWLLTGTPIPNTPVDLYPALSAFRFLPAGKRRFTEFRDRFCVVREQYVRGVTIKRIVGSRNLEELRDVLSPHMLQRKQSDVGITEPVVETLPIFIKPADAKRIVKELEAAAPGAVDDILNHGFDAIDQDAFSTLRRITGTFKAPAVADVIIEDVESGIRKMVVMAWHRDTMDVIERTVRNAGIRVLRVDGSTTPAKRAEREAAFRDGDAQVFLGQIVACGEAIDLSAASDLLFAESSYVPKDMKQASLRITNHNQTAQPRVRVATLADSIDERIQRAVLRKMRDIGVVEGRDVEAAS